MPRVHILRAGRALCGWPGVPADWPAGHLWVTDVDAGHATCGPCIAQLGVPIWVVYVRPRDLPDAPYVVRRHTSLPGSVVVDAHAHVFQTLTQARQWLTDQGLTCLGRQPEDDPVIVETWM